MIPTLLVVALGGSLGAVARYVLSAEVQARAGTGFPVGTLVVNLCGAFILGLLLPRLEPAAAVPAMVSVGATPATLFLVTGVLGSFTTFSTFAFEIHALHRGGRPAAAAAYAAVSVLGGVLLVLAGSTLGR